MKEIKTKSIVDEASGYVGKLFKEKLPANYLYHNMNHAEETAQAAREIAGEMGLPEDQVELLSLAALFHDSGYVFQYQDHEKRSCETAREFLEKAGYPADRIEVVEELILSTDPKHEPETLLQSILHDADMIKIGKDTFFFYGKLLRAEWELVLNRKHDDVEWEKLQYKFISSADFKTAYAKKKYGDKLKLNIEDQKKKLSSVVESSRKESKSGGRGIETMYRSTYRNHMSLSQIADNKANIMISINTIIMSVIITVIGSGFTFSQNFFIERLRFTAPITLLLITCTVAVAFAISSARPKVTSKYVDIRNFKNKGSSILFFGNFTNLSLEKFVDDLEVIRNERELLYDHMSVDIYNLGKVLKKKYRLLRISYNVFMVGFVVTVATFIILFLFFSNKPG